MNEALLKQMAATSGGAFYREETLHELPMPCRQKRKGGVGGGCRVVGLAALLSGPAGHRHRRVDIAQARAVEINESQTYPRR